MDSQTCGVSGFASCYTAIAPAELWEKECEEKLPHSFGAGTSLYGAGSTEWVQVLQTNPPGPPQRAGWMVSAWTQTSEGNFLLLASLSERPSPRGRHVWDGSEPPEMRLRTGRYRQRVEPPAPSSSLVLWLQCSVAYLEGAELLSACPDLTPRAGGAGRDFWGAFSCKWEMIEMPQCQDGDSVPCCLSAMQRREGLSGSFPGRCCVWIGLPILALLLWDGSNIPGHLRLRWLFFKAPGLVPRRVRLPPRRAPRQLGCQHLGFPALLEPAQGCRDVLARVDACAASVWLLHEGT